MMMSEIATALIVWPSWLMLIQQSIFAINAIKFL